MNREVPKGLMILFIVIGSILFFGFTIYNIVNDRNHSDYLKTTATFVRVGGECPDYDDESASNSTYHLIYKYNVKANQYYYITDYCTSIIPKIGSEIEIKYNPSDPQATYSTSFNIFSIFQIIGVMFIIIPLIILFSEWFWVRDILMFLGTLSLIITLITNNLYTGGAIIALIILGIMCIASLADFVKLLINNGLHPLEDIKAEINESRQIKLNKKLLKQNIPEALRNKRKKKIIIGILLLLTLPLDIFISAKGWYPNETIYIIVTLISIICFFIGFFVVGMTLTNSFPSNDEEITISVAGKVIDEEDIQNAKDMSLSEKVEAFNVIGVTLRILSVPGGLGLFLFVLSDPFNLFKVFKNVAQAQIYAVIIIAVVLNLLFALYPKQKWSKLSTIITIIVECIFTLYLIYYFICAV